MNAAETAHELARRVFAAIGHSPTTDMLEWLAIALSRGYGVVPDRGTGYVYVVVSPPLEAVSPEESSYRPVLLHGAIPDGKRSREIRTTGRVASGFRRNCRNLGQVRPPGYANTWTAAATDSLMYVSLAGDLPPVGGTTPDAVYPGNTYQWYNLDLVPIGGVVFHVKSNLGLWLFYREAPNVWRKLVLAQPAEDVLNVAAVVANMRADHPNLQLRPLQGQLPAFRESLPEA